MNTEEPTPQEQAQQLSDVLRALMNNDVGTAREQAISLRDAFERTLGITPEQRMEYELIEECYSEIMEDEAQPPELLGISEMAMDLVIHWAAMESDSLTAERPSSSRDMFVAGLTAGIATGLRLAQKRQEQADG